MRLVHVLRELDRDGIITSGSVVRRNSDGELVLYRELEQRTWEMLRQQAEMYLASQAETFSCSELVVDTEVVIGVPYTCIVAAAVCQPDTLIAMSTHGHGGLRRWALGSVTDKVIQTTTVPVFVVRSSAHAHACDPVFRRIMVPLDGSDLARRGEGAGAVSLLRVPAARDRREATGAGRSGGPGALRRCGSGLTLPDPHPEVRAQWAVFEAMIMLMTPQGFAGLMGTMWPELIDAMPLGMGAMMRTMGHVPGALELMRPLFPRLLPLMLPKVMPAMLERVKQRIPMPDYMAEQMPDLMPKVMGRLMPHMIGDVVPLVTQPMIDYLHGKATETVQ